MASKKNVGYGTSTALAVDRGQEAEIKRLRAFNRAAMRSAGSRRAATAKARAQARSTGSKTGALKRAMAGEGPKKGMSIRELNRARNAKVNRVGSMKGGNAKRGGGFGGGG